jgi:hypoxanthine phosphoribosyltransferase
MIKESDIKPLITENELQTEIKKLAEKLNEKYKDKEVYLICVLKGSVMFMADLAKHLKMPVKMEFIRLSSYGNGTSYSGKVNAVDIKLPDLNDKNVLIIEDIIDTGHTAKFLVDFLNHNFRFRDLKFCALLDKKVKRAADINADYYCFEVDDKFVVGYGLDVEGLYRNLPYIGYVEV